MDIQECIEKKREAEQEISKILKELQSKTGLYVDGVSVNNIDDYIGSFVFVSIDMRL